MPHKDQAELVKIIKQTEETIRVGGLYAHYKNPNRLYKIIGIGLQEADEQPCVIYRLAAEPNSIIWVRNLSDWSATIRTESGQNIPRFSEK